MTIAYEKILVPYDFSTHADRALEVAVDLASALDAKLHLVYAVHPPTFVTPTAALGGTAAQPVVDLRAWERDAGEKLAKVASGISTPKGIENHVITLGTPAEAICTLAEKIKADLIVMGSHGRTGLAQVFLGSVAERTLRNAPCPVMTVRSDSDDSTDQQNGEQNR